MAFVSQFVAQRSEKKCPSNPKPLLTCGGLKCLDFSVLRRMATVVTLFGEKHFLGVDVPTNEAQSVYLMLGGALVAGWGDLEFHLLGYVLVAVNCVFTAWYLLAIKRAQSLKLNVFGQMLYTNVFGAPIFFILFILTESSGVFGYQHWTSPGFLVRRRCTSHCAGLLIGRLF